MRNSFADENRKKLIWGKKVKLEKFSTVSGNKGEMLKQGVMHHCLRGDDAPASESFLVSNPYN